MRHDQIVWVSKRWTRKQERFNVQDSMKGDYDCATHASVAQLAKRLGARVIANTGTVFTDNVGAGEWRVFMP